MYGKKRIVISESDENLLPWFATISLKGEGSSQKLGRLGRCSMRTKDSAYHVTGFIVYLANGTEVAIVRTKREAKIAIFNAAKKSKDHFIGQSLTIDSNGQLSS